MKVFTIFLSFLAIIGTFLPLFRHSYWWIRIFDYPQVQIAALCIISIILLIINFGLKSKWTIILSTLLLGALVYKAPQILRYTPLTAVNAKDSEIKEGPNCFRIIQSNVKMDNREATEVRELVYLYRPDILLIVEPDQWWMDQLSGFDSLFDYSIKKPQENTYGLILYSKFPFVKTEVNYLVKNDIPSFFATILLPNGKEFDLHCLHPEPPKPGTDTYERDAELLIVGKRIKKANKPSMVVGDLNDVAWSHTSELFQRYSDLLDPREGRSFYNTYNANLPLLRYPLDHFFYSKEFGLVELKKLEKVGSDHYPMLMDVCLEEKLDHSQNQETVDEEDNEEVEEKIDERNKE